MKHYNGIESGSHFMIRKKILISVTLYHCLETLR